MVPIMFGLLVKVPSTVTWWRWGDRAITRILAKRVVGKLDKMPSFEFQRRIRQAWHPKACAESANYLDVRSQSILVQNAS
jgi:hypothetical protein